MPIVLFPVRFFQSRAPAERAGADGAPGNVCTLPASEPLCY